MDEWRRMELFLRNKCKIRSKSHSDSGVCRTVIPEHAAQSFRSMSHTFQGN